MTEKITKIMKKSKNFEKHPNKSTIYVNMCNNTKSPWSIMQIQPTNDYGQFKCDQCQKVKYYKE